MAGLTIEGAQKRFGSRTVFERLDLRVEQGEFVVVVGPSGCGKSTLLRLVAGLDTLDGGQIQIGDRRVDTLSPSERGIAMVFQSYALYPQMTVAQNIAFPLRMARKSPAEVDRQVHEVAGLLGLSEMLERRPSQLSGGQRQRVAIGRAIIRQPQLFLFDEPLSNLDAGLRSSMRREFAELHRRIGATTVYVTHDQAEAMAMADRIALMREGRIVQFGTPRELYLEPVDLFAALFFGHPAINLLKGRIEDAGPETMTVAVEGRSWRLPAPIADRAEPGMPVTLGIRPQDLVPDRGAGSAEMPERSVRLTEWYGNERLAILQSPQETAGDGDMVWQTTGCAALNPGDTVELFADPARIHVFGPEGARLR